MSYLLGHDALMVGSSVLPKPAQRVPLSSRRLSGVRRTSLGPTPPIVKPVSLTTVDALDKENQSMGAARLKRRATINTNNTVTVPASPAVASPSNGKSKKKRGSLGRRVSFSSEIAIRKMRRESEAPYEDITDVMKSSPTSLTPTTAEAILTVAASFPIPVIEASLTAIVSPARSSLIPAPMFRAEAFQSEASASGSPSLQELLREDALVGGADASMAVDASMSMDLTRVAGGINAVAPSPAAPAVQHSLINSPAIHPSAQESSMLASPFRLPRVATAAFTSPRPLDDGPSLADLSLSALNSPPASRTADASNMEFTRPVGGVMVSPALSDNRMLPPASPGAALAALLPSAKSPEQTMDFTATLQQQLTGVMELTRPVGGILCEEGAANMSIASANATSDADRMLSLNSTSASVDMTFATTTGALLNHSVAQSPMVPPTPGSANATQDLSATLSILRSGPVLLPPGATTGVFSGLLARAAALTSAAPTAMSAPAAVQLTAEIAPEPTAEVTMDFTRAIGGVIGANTSKSEDTGVPMALTEALTGHIRTAATPSPARRQNRTMSPSDLMAFENQSVDMSGVITLRFLDFSTVGAQPTGDVSMDLTQALGTVTAATAKSSEDTGSIPMALTGALTSHIRTAAPTPAEASNTAPIAAPTLAVTVAQSPVPIPTTPGRAAAKQLSVDEFYMRAAVRFLPVDRPAPPTLIASSSNVGDSFSAAEGSLATTVLGAAVTLNGATVYEEAAAELAGPVLDAIEGGIEETEAQISRANPAVFREVQGARSEALAAQQQLKNSKSNARIQARGQWAKWRTFAIEAKLAARLAPIAESLRADLKNLQERQVVLREVSERVSNECTDMRVSKAQPAHSAAAAKAERDLIEAHAFYKQLTTLMGWRLSGINSNGISLRWRESFELHVFGSNGSFSGVQCRFFDTSIAAIALYNSANIPALFAASSARPTSALPGLLQSAAVKLGRVDTLLAEIKKLSGRHIAHTVVLEGSVRLFVDFSSSPAGGSNARTRFTVAFSLNANYPFSELAFELCPHFGDVTPADVAGIVAAHTSFQRLTRICADLQGIAQ